MTNETHDRPKVTVPELARMKALGEKITMITAYDVTFARLVDARRGRHDPRRRLGRHGGAGRGQHDSCRTRRHGVPRAPGVACQAAALIVGDLPFGSYQVSPQQAVESSIRLMKEGAECVKLEGGVVMAETIHALTRVDIPVVGHIGLTPQSFHRMGGHRCRAGVSGYEAGGRERLLDDAIAVEQAGACAVVIEGVPLDLAAEITPKLSIPTIGIGAGPSCDGQVLVLHDVLGSQRPVVEVHQAVRQPAHGGDRGHGRIRREVRDGTWPDDAHSFH